MMVVDDDRMFLSQGEPFASRKPYRESNENKESATSQQVEAVITEVGPYTIGEYLGRGGFGEVRVGINQLSGEKVALKFLRKCDICTVKAAERTGTEIQCLSSLNHPNIIRLFVVCSNLINFYFIYFIYFDMQTALMKLTF
jgi:5'-AMP-activated protein kinase, catalytic alpha subunit